jgi:hypothetical protein
MVKNETLCMTAVKVFNAGAHTIYIAKILWAKNYVPNWIETKVAQPKF